MKSIFLVLLFPGCLCAAETPAQPPKLEPAPRDRGAFEVRVPAPGPDTIADSVIQDAIDAVAAAGGGVVLLGAGDFKLSRQAGDETVVIRSNVTLRGQGYATHIYLDPKTPPNPLRYFPLRIGTGKVPASNVVIEQLRYTGHDKAIGGGSIMGLNARLDDPESLLLSCDNVSIRHCWIYDAKQAAGCSKPGGSMYEAKTVITPAEATAASKSGAGPRNYTTPDRLASQFKNWQVCHNFIDTCGNKAVELAECNGGLIADNTMTNVVDGPQVIFGSRNVQIRDNEVYFTRTGINITEGSNHIRVSGNHVEPVPACTKNAANACLLFRTEPLPLVSTISHVVVTGNVFRDQTTQQKGTVKFITRPESLGCTYEAITLTGNVFDGDVFILDSRSPAMTTIRDLIFADNICEGDLISEPAGMMASNNVMIRGNQLRKTGNYSLQASGWIWSGNSHPGGSVAIASGAEGNIVHGNVIATEISDQGTKTDLANNIIHSAAAAAMSIPRIGAEQQQDGAKGIDIGADRQLFIDDTLIDRTQTQNISRTLNPPESIQQVLQPDQPWEALGFIFYCSVVDDNGAVKLFHGSYDAEKKKYFSLATSSDGLHWERPTLGLKTFQDTKNNNILPVEAVEASVFFDPHAPPEKRFRLIYTKGWPDPAKAGVFVASSSDGVQWTSVPERLLPFVPDSQPSAVWDEQLQKYAIYLRAWDPVRTVARVEVSDLETPWPYDHSVSPFQVWGKEKIPTLSRELPRVLAPDEQDPEHVDLYTSAVVKYPFAPNVYFAFPAAFQLYKGDEWKSRACNTADGTFDVQFAASRDGIAWNRWREPYVAAGVHEGLDLRIVSMGPGMVRRGRLLYQYFVGDTFTHGRPAVWDKNLENRAEWLKKDRGGIYCATQRLDGFVSMNASNTLGTLTTLPLVFKGDRLHLNIHTAGSGRVKAALLQADGTPHPGFTMSDCEIISADEIDYEVRWKGNADISALAGKPVRVQLEMCNAKLYALQFGSTPNDASAISTGQPK